MAKLTQLGISRATAPAMLGDGNGLWLQVRHNSKAWIFRYARDGKARAMGLGAADVVTLKRARELVLEQRRLLAEGIDPLEQRQAKRTAATVDAAGAVTFKEFALDYIRSHRHAWRSEVHALQWETSLERFVYPIIGGLPVRAIDTPLVLRVLQPIWHTIPETGSRVRGRLERILSAAKVAGLRSGENPAAWRNHLEALLPKASKLRKVEHYAALPYQEIAAFMQALQTRKGMGAMALQFLILTAARSGEVLAAKWTEVDLRHQVWTVPAARMKMGKEHRVPLSAPAMALLQPLYDVRQNEYVFPGNSNGRLAGATMNMLLEIMGRRDVTPHGFRSSFRDWAAEQTSYPSEVVEQALAHAVGSAVERAYKRTDLFDKRRKLMDSWAAYCEQLQTTAEVVPIRMQTRSSVGTDP
jgi:integrase